MVSSVVWRASSALPSDKPLAENPFVLIFFFNVELVAVGVGMLDVKTGREVELEVNVDGEAVALTARGGGIADLVTWEAAGLGD